MLFRQCRLWAAFVGAIAVAAHDETSEAGSACDSKGHGFVQSSRTMTEKIAAHSHSNTTSRCRPPATTSCPTGRNYFPSCPLGLACVTAGCWSCPANHHVCDINKPFHSGNPVCPNTHHCTAAGCETGPDPNLQLLEQCGCTDTCVSPSNTECPAGRNYFASCASDKVCVAQGCWGCPSGHHVCDVKKPYYYGSPVCPNTHHCCSAGCCNGPDPLLYALEQCDCSGGSGVAGSTTATTTQAPFPINPVEKPDCVDGSVAIESEEECEKAALANGFKYKGRKNFNRRVRGCFWKQPADKVFWNEPSKPGRTTGEGVSMICKSA